MRELSRQPERRRQAHLYVFAVLAHRSKATLNPLELEQWEFSLLEASVLNERLEKQRRVSLNRVIELGAVRCRYANLRRTIAEVEARTTSAPA